MEETLAEIEKSLTEMRVTLMADGYTLSVAHSPDGLDVQISAGTEACEDCLIPKPLMVNMIRSKLPDPGLAITVRYPADS